MVNIPLHPEHIEVDDSRMKVDNPPYVHKTFTTFEEASAYQRKTLLDIIQDGYTIRTADFQSETDFDTKVTWWVVFIRAFKVQNGA